MSIKHWAACSRPRERLLSMGADTLTDAELLAIALRTGTKGTDAVSLAQHLIDHFGGFNHLLSADRATLCQQPGLGEATYALLQAILEMARRHAKEPLTQDAIFNASSRVKTYLAHELKQHQREVFACLFLDNAHRFLAFEKPFWGTLTSASIHPREIVKSAMHHNAACVILAHNHPSSGSARPSQADQEATRRIRQALALVDVDVLDHCIVGETDVNSFAELGLLQ